MNLIQHLVKNDARNEKGGKICPPSWLPSNTHYVVMMGSHAYGTNGPDSDCDIYGWAIPPKEIVFPHTNGIVFGFGDQGTQFNQYQEQHVTDPTKNIPYDISVYSIVRYFHLVMDNNPNMVDSLFVPEDCVMHATSIARMVRERRDIFLSKKSWHTFKGYAYSQLKKAENRKPEGKRVALVEQHGFDTKFASHIVRLMDEVEQILTLGTIDLRRNREHLKAIRRGDVPFAEIQRWFYEKESVLEVAYQTSPLPWKPREAEIKQLLIDCLEHHYGSLERVITTVDPYVRAVNDIRSILDKLE